MPRFNGMARYIVPDERAGSGLSAIRDYANQPLDSNEYNAALAATTLSATPFGIPYVVPSWAATENFPAGSRHPLFPFLAGYLRYGNDKGAAFESDRFQNLMSRLARQYPDSALGTAALGGVSTGLAGGVTAAERAAATPLATLFGLNQMASDLNEAEFRSKPRRDPK